MTVGIAGEKSMLQYYHIPLMITQSHLRYHKIRHHIKGAFGGSVHRLIIKQTQPFQGIKGMRINRNSEGEGNLLL